MTPIALMLLTFFGYIIAFHTYGRFLSRRIFALNDEALVPSKEFEDGKDFVPSRKGIVFGHHFASIAGTGPIVGPAIGIIWGWVPALLWVFLGSILMGAVHDLGALVVSLRNQGKSISDITVRYIGPRAKYLFFLIVFLELLIVLAIFGLVIAIIFDNFPQSVFAIWMQIPIAVGLGWVITRRKKNIAAWTALAVALMYLTIVAGMYLPFEMPSLAGMEATGVWTIILLVYAFVASILPVTVLLQPRDYINAWQLFFACGLLVMGAVASGLTAEFSLVAPAFNLKPSGAPPIFPFLFITIACGAISGFHALVSSGTSSKQLSRESDAQFVGYGGMLTEAAVATLVLIAVGAGIGMGYTTDGVMLKGSDTWHTHYTSWKEGLGPGISAFVAGAANMMKSLKIPQALGIAIMGVFIASFAGTTLDTAARVQRYVVTELFSDLKVHFMTRRYPATFFAVLTAACLAFATGADGKGAMELWPMFGAVNQLLAALALLVITIYLKKSGGKKYLVTALPCLFMLAMTIWGVILNEASYIGKREWVLISINGAVLVLALWIVAESAFAFFWQGHRRSGNAR